MSTWLRKTLRTGKALLWLCLWGTSRGVNMRVGALSAGEPPSMWAGPTQSTGDPGRMKEEKKWNVQGFLPLSWIWNTPSAPKHQNFRFSSLWTPWLKQAAPMGLRPLTLGSELHHWLPCFSSLESWIGPYYQHPRVSRLQLACIIIIQLNFLRKSPFIYLGRQTDRQTMDSVSLEKPDK